MFTNKTDKKKSGPMFGHMNFQLYYQCRQKYFTSYEEKHSDWKSAIIFEWNPKFRERLILNHFYTVFMVYDIFTLNMTEGRCSDNVTVIRT